MNEKDFYVKCAYLLGVRTEYRDPTHVPVMPDREGNNRTTYKNRWNGRDPGNGRFPKCGLIRCFGSIVHVTLRNPPLSGTYSSFEEALEAIAEAAIPKGCPRVLEERCPYCVGRELEDDEHIPSSCGHGVPVVRLLTEAELQHARDQFKLASVVIKELLHRKGVRIDPRIAEARLMLEEEREIMEEKTREAYAEVAALLKDRKPRFANRRRCPRCDTIVNQRCDAELCGYNE